MLKHISTISVSVNIAQGKWTAQSGILKSGKGTAEKAIDGIYDTSYNHGGCTHTPYTHHPWWAIDLVHERDIVEVVLWNRGDCCGKKTYLLLLPMKMPRQYYFKEE